jgi:hypothetical protein
LGTGKIVLHLLESQFVAANANRIAVDHCRHNHTLVIDKGAVAAAEIDELITVAIVTPQKRVLTGNKRAATQANGIIASAADGRSVANGHFERLARQWRDAN